MSAIEKVAAQIGIRRSDDVRDPRFHSVGTVGITLADLVSLERELRREIANSIWSAPVACNATPTLFELAEHEVARLESVVSSLNRKARSGSPVDVQTLGERSGELDAAKARLAEMQLPLAV
ncbi:hypothetical protein RBA41_31225 [Massilia sp. CCM 9210]|uniref:hypothetical protein n=1 Tax=Massilia scottii TaxID=3057166 RepID=UPI0027969CB5|nr:hypothetical protein [Massilia sp. CCM 9210]MDQ1817782.1 hypothetical protein [Massilia sp. CCM 9210]